MLKWTLCMSSGRFPPRKVSRYVTVSRVEPAAPYHHFVQLAPLQSPRHHERKIADDRGIRRQRPMLGNQVAPDSIGHQSRSPPPRIVPEARIAQSRLVDLAQEPEVRRRRCSSSADRPAANSAISAGRAESGAVDVQPFEQRFDHALHPPEIAAGDQRQVRWFNRQRLRRDEPDTRWRSRKDRRRLARASRCAAGRPASWGSGSAAGPIPACGWSDRPATARPRRTGPDRHGQPVFDQAEGHGFVEAGPGQRIWRTADSTRSRCPRGELETATGRSSGI